MKKFMLVLMMLLFSVFVVAETEELTADDIPMPDLEDTVFAPSVLNLKPGGKPTIPTLDPTHTPLIRNNLFGINFSEWMGAEGTEITPRTTFKSKDKWYGMDTYGDKGTASVGFNYKFPTTESLGGTFSFDAEYIGYMGGGTPSQYNSQYIVYRLYFDRSYYEGESHQVNLTVGHNYYDLRGSNTNDGQEFGAGISFPRMFEWGKFNLVPSAYLGYMWDLQYETNSANIVNQFKGTVGTVAVDLYYAPDPEAEHFLFDFYTRVNYNDSARIDGQKFSKKFTDVTFGAALDFELAHGVIATPSVNYVRYFDRLSSGRKDDVWTGVTLRYNF